MLIPWMMSKSYNRNYSKKTRNFQNKTLKIEISKIIVEERIYGTEVSINNERANYVDKVDENVSILFPAPFKILVKGTDVSLKRDDISIVYVAVPATVSKTTDFIDLPQVYNEAIYNYMAYKAHVSVKGDMKEENNTYYLRYQESLRNIRLLGMVNSDNLDPSPPAKIITFIFLEFD